MSFLDHLITSYDPGEWQQFSKECGGQFVPRENEADWAFQARIDEWLVTFDAGSGHFARGSSGDGAGRLRAPFVNRGRFSFTLSRANLVTGLSQWFGQPDVETGYPEFDRAFLVQSARPRLVRRLLANPQLRALLLRQPSVYLTVRDDELGIRFPTGVDELYLETSVPARSVARLRELHELFRITLEVLREIDNPHPDPVLRQIDALQDPGGQIVHRGIVLWDGHTRRRNAARRLGELKDRRGGAALISGLSDADPVLRVHCAWALGELGEPEAVPHLLPLLGQSVPPHAWLLEALEKLGAGPVAEAFCGLLSGRPFGAALLAEHASAPLQEALVSALALCDAATAARLAYALAEQAAVEHRSAVREALHRHRHATGWIVTSLRNALERLERQASLPRPGLPSPPDPSSLPRPTT
jgi:hypothetical protein